MTSLLPNFLMRAQPLVAVFAAALGASGGRYEVGMQQFGSRFRPSFKAKRKVENSREPADARMDVFACDPRLALLLSTGCPTKVILDP
jgi:hypothetical protein